MKNISLFILMVYNICCANNAVAQVNINKEANATYYQQQFNSVSNKTTKIENAFAILNFYIENDYDDSAQTWIYTLIDLNSQLPNDTINYFIHTRQTEIFYFSNLMQFGLAAANKSLAIANKIGDSILIADAYAFKGFIYEGMDSLQQSKEATIKAKNNFPKKATTYKLSLIKYSQIINQLAQLYVKTQQLDSAYYFNNLAYTAAINEDSKRAAIMCLSTFGNIYTAKNNNDSATFYFNLSTTQSQQNNCYDIQLWNIGKQMLMQQNNSIKSNELYAIALQLLAKEKINSIYQKLFFYDALQVFKAQKNSSNIANVQQKLLLLIETDSHNGNRLTQDISEKYVTSENNVLKLTIAELSNNKRLSRLQIISIISLALLAIAFAYFLYHRKKNKLLLIIQQQELLQIERNRIARDMHDDLGSGLTRINYVAQQALTQEPTKKDLTNIKDISTKLVESMREIIWAMKDDNNTLQELLYYIKDYTVNYCMENKLITQINFPQNLPNLKIQGQNRRHIFLSIKEALHNVVKHSNAKNVELNVQFADSNWQIIIKDDGIGSPETNITNHYGLYNITKRMQQLNGSFNCTKDNGFELILTLPYSL